MDRLSEFTRLAKERTLSEAEQAERQTLREEYLAEWRNSTKAVLENTYLEGEDGSRRKLRRK